jgi:hypothetical protein
MKSSQMLAAVLTCLTAVAMPPGYAGKPFRDQFHKSGPQVIPGTVQLVLLSVDNTARWLEVNNLRFGTVGGGRGYGTRVKTLNS